MLDTQKKYKIRVGNNIVGVQLWLTKTEQWFINELWKIVSEHKHPSLVLNREYSSYDYDFIIDLSVKNKAGEQMQDFVADEISYKIHYIEGVSNAYTVLYDDNEVYRTGERQLDTRIDGTGARRDATPFLNTSLKDAMEICKSTERCKDAAQ